MKRRLLIMAALIFLTACASSRSPDMAPLNASAISGRQALTYSPPSEAVSEDKPGSHNFYLPLTGRGFLRPPQNPLLYYELSALASPNRPHLGPLLPPKKAAPLQIEGRYIDPSKPMIALTFDDGPSAYTLQILSALERYGGRATFCVLGDLLEDGAAVVARARSLGCEVIGHSWDHKNLTKLTEAEIRAQILDTSRAIQSITGVAPNIYRPPYGAVNERVLRVSAELGFAVINWNVDPEDWKNRNPDMIYSAIMRDATDRSIILAHDTYSETAGAVTRAIRDLTAQGYQLVTVSELLHHTHGQIQAGEIYYSGNTVIGR